ncbi:MAG: formylglycine-generating enzyme family protein, partial [Planctomycetes bacterium]|nr:formylglycine-generating enzyme family protein [Planctomycetota bacterium]
VTMGAQAVDAAAANHDAAAGPYETPVHVVELEPFFLAKYETTQQQWQRLSDGGNPSVYAFGRQMTAGPQLTGRNPVENVSQRMALEVLQQHGLGLPTEAQWEYACRAGTSTPWHFGARELAVEYANFADRAAVRGGARWETEPDLDDGHIVHAPVGSFRCNDFGLHDMHGNVSELTLDRMAWYWRPTEPGSGLRVVPYDARSVVFRGGDHGMTLTALRSSDRSLSETVDYRSGTLGVRAARAVER